MARLHRWHLGPWCATACTPRQEVCSDGHVFVCDATGKLKKADDCGTAGCRQSQCLECKPGTISCDGNTVITCNADGSQVLTRTACGDGGCGSVCQAGQCVAGMVAEGTACNGGDDDFCNSSCNNAGQCVGVAPDCTDDNVCSEDSCVAAIGCVNDFAALLGTGCGSGADKCAASCSTGGECLDSLPVACAGACAVCASSSGKCVAGKLGQECRAVAGGCDIAETCDSGLECPMDGFEDAGEVCLTAQADALCDLDDVCDGVSAACVAKFRPSDYECRAGAAGTDRQRSCDVAEFCTSDSPDCPADIVHVNGEQCRNAACDEGTYSSFGCSAAGECVETTEKCGACIDSYEVANSCTVEGCVNSAKPRDCSRACAACSLADQVICDPATDTCSGNIPSGCTMKLTELDNTRTTVIVIDTGCLGQIVTCQAIGRFYIVQDGAVSNEFNEFNGTAEPPTFGWQGPLGRFCDKIPTDCPGGATGFFAGVAATTANVGTFSFIADVSGFSKIEHSFLAGENAEAGETLSLRYCCGDNSCPPADPPFWSLAGTGNGGNWGLVGNADLPDFGSPMLAADCQAATSPALRPRSILKTEFTVVADEVDEFGVDNFTLTGVTAVPLEMFTIPRVVAQYAEFPSDAPRPVRGLSLRYKCTWQATGQTASIWVKQ